MRKLASIQKIVSMDPIAGKDFISIARVLGWQVIVRKDQFNIDDLCVYIEIDSVVPENERFEFLRKNKFRVKTIKIAGVVSQGLCMPLSILPKGHYKEDDDVTNLLGITQYEPTMDKESAEKETKAVGAKYPTFLMKFNFFRQMVYKKDHREGKGFPKFIPKTDETRIQSIPSVLDTDDLFIATEKIDGQSGTFALVKRKRFFGFMPAKYEYIVCSRNVRLYRRDGSSYWSVSDRYDIKNVLMDMIGDKEWIAIQGECIAPGVQSNKYKVDSPDLYVFNILTPTKRLDSVLAREIVEQHGMKFVPIVSINKLPETVDEVLEYAHGTSYIGDTLREGIVFRDMDGVRSFKAVDPLFLLKYNE